MTHINLKLTVSSFNTLMTGLQEMPFRLANPVVLEIQPQVEAQKQSATAEAENQPSPQTT